MRGETMSKNLQDFNKFFYPESVAVVGASVDPKKTGHVMLNNLLSYGYKGKIYPINPGAEEILGVKSYKSILEIPGEVDLVIFTIPAKGIVDTMEECGNKGVKAAVVHSAGFAESGEEGKRLQDRMVEIANKFKVNIIGPNCMGIMCVETRLPWARRTTFPEMPGGVAVISQSGGGGGSFVNLADERGIRFSKIVTIGNECDVSVLDLLDYFGDDPATNIIFIYLECFRDGHRFLEIAKRVSVKKPIIIYKIGRTDAGARAAASHTGSLAGSIQVYDGAFKQTGIIRAEGIAEALDIITIFEKVWFGQGKPAGDRVGIVTGPGGPGVATADACVESGLSVPMISEATKKKLSEAIPQATRSNPMDMGDFGFVAALKERDPYGIMTGFMEEDENIDMVAVMGPGEANPGGFMESILNINKSHKKPFIVIWPSAGKEVEECKVTLMRAGVPLFLTPEGAAKALGAMMRYKKLIKKLEV